MGWLKSVSTVRRQRVTSEVRRLARVGGRHLAVRRRLLRFGGNGGRRERLNEPCGSTSASAPPAGERRAQFGTIRTDAITKEYVRFAFEAK